MALIPPFDKPTANGCHAQVLRAKACNQLESDVLDQEQVVTVTLRGAGLAAQCECRIAENGTLDPSLCLVAHSYHAIPYLQRWCDQSTGLLQGAGYLIFWSGWARPAVMKLLGRFPPAADVQTVLARTPKTVSHRRMTFTATVAGQLLGTSNKIVQVRYAKQIEGGKAALKILEELDHDDTFAAHARSTTT
jgi:hypothetical protein